MKVMVIEKNIINYFNRIKEYLKDIINELKIHGKSK